MSRYSKLLTKIIAESGYTAKEIVQKCNDIGNGIDTTRLSKLQNGKLSAPSEKVSRDIARICNADERLLVMEGYLEKAPKEIIDLLLYLKQITLPVALKVYENDFTQDVLELIKEEYNKEPLSDFIVSLLDMGNNTQIINKMTEIKATDDNIKLNLTEPISITVKDNSMYPKIPEGAKIILKIQNQYKNGDILAVRVNNEELIRYAIFNNDTIILAPLNNKYETLTYNLKDIVISGRVTKTITDI